VDDQRTKRSSMRNILQILDAASGEEALELLESTKTIPNLALIDYNMTGINGFQLCKEIRKSHSKNDFALIGVSASEEKYITSLFIKSGANDFIYFPFSPSEFIARINQNVDRIHHFKEIENIAYKDYLTDLYNRRYFFERFNELMHQVKRKNLKFTISIGLTGVDEKNTSD
jgi:PleD family two-component response regulator